MGRLDTVVQMLEQRRRPPPSAADYLNSAQPNHMAQSESAYLNNMLGLMDKRNITPDDVKDGFIALASGMVNLDQQIGELSAAVEKRPDSLDPVLSEVAKLKAGLQKLVDAIRSIKLPDVHIPENKETDLTPLQDSIADLKVLIASLERTAESQEAMPVSGPTEWTFEVKRNQAGYIKTVEARKV